MIFPELSLELNLVLFGAVALVIAVGGSFMTNLADRIADHTMLGEAMVGGALLGASTSLSGTVTSVSSAAIGHPDLAVSNAIGGIAAQTVFLAIADIVHRPANLEHAAASLTNLTQASLLIVMLSLAAMAIYIPELEIFHVHIVSPILLGTYIFGLALTKESRKAPMWTPKNTSETRRDIPEEDSDQGRATAVLIVRFVTIAAIVGVAGWALANMGIEIAAKTGLNETAVGALMTATATSLPELVTTVAAVRRNALQLAVGGIIGGNTFDVLFLVLSDVAYRPGSIYHAADSDYQFWIAISLLMTGILLLGLLKRQKHGFANIGFESALIIIIYICAVLVGTTVL